MKNYYLPANDSDRLVWLQNFAAKLPSYATKYGITTAEQTDMTASLACLQYWLNIRNQIEESMRRVVAFKEELQNGATTNNATSIAPTAPNWGTAPAAVAPNIFGRARTIVGKIKAQKSIYTEADGKDLGIIGEDVVLDTINAKPAVSARINAGHPEIIWKKSGMDGVNIYVDRTGSGTFTFLARDSKPNYIDMATLPVSGQSAVWAYKVVYVKEDLEVGMVSDVLQVTVTGMI